MPGGVHAWEVIFMLLVLKVPMLYVGAVVWYAVRAAPEPPPEHAETLLPEPPSPWKPWESRRYRRRLRGPSRLPRAGIDRGGTRRSRPAEHRASSRQS